MRARLLDLVPVRSGKVYGDWLTDRGDAFRTRVQVATLDPFHGYKNAVDDHLEDATAVLDAFHVIKLGTDTVDRLPAGIDADKRHLPVWLAWSCAQQMRAAYRHPKPAESRKIAEQVLASFPTCPVPESARLGRTLKQWRDAF